MRAKIAFAGILALFATCNLNAQFGVRPDAHATAGPVVTMDDLQTAAHRYFRDTAELPMVQTTTFSVTDLSGRKRKLKAVKGSYLFQGYNQHRHSTQVNLAMHESMWAELRGSKLLWISGNSAVWTTVPGASLYANRDTYKFQVTANPESLTTATLTPVRPCPFSMNDRNSRYYFPDDLCGPSQFELSKDLVFQKFSYNAPGLPAPVKLDPFGHCTLRTYHTDITFQSVNLPGESDPFLVPKQATTTLETDKGTIVISSTYKPKQAAGK